MTLAEDDFDHVGFITFSIVSIRTLHIVGEALKDFVFVKI